MISLNTVDIFIGIILGSIIYIGKRGNLIAESIKLFGIFCTTFVSLHYYGRFAGMLRAQFFGPDASTELFAYSLLAIAFFVVFLIISQGWVAILQLKIHPTVNKWGSLAVSCVRGYLMCSLIFIALFMSEHQYASPRAHDSTSRWLFQLTAVDIYKGLYDGMVKNIFSGEKINAHVFDVVGLTLDDSYTQTP